MVPSPSPSPSPRPPARSASASASTPTPTAPAETPRSTSPATAAEIARLKSENAVLAARLAHVHARIAAMEQEQARKKAAVQAGLEGLAQAQAAAARQRQQRERERAEREWEREHARNRTPTGHGRTGMGMGGMGGIPHAGLSHRPHEYGHARSSSTPSIGTSTMRTPPRSSRTATRATATLAHEIECATMPEEDEDSSDDHAVFHEAHSFQPRSLSSELRGHMATNVDSDAREEEYASALAKLQGSG